MEKQSFKKRKSKPSLTLALLENRCQNKYQRTSKGRNEGLDDCENKDEFRKEVEVFMNGEYLIVMQLGICLIRSRKLEIEGQVTAAFCH